MKKITRPIRVVTFLLCTCVLFSSSYPFWQAVADAVNASEFCEHHPVHTESCGYAEGAPCTHEHDENCYELACGHVHTEECYSVEDTDAADGEPVQSEDASDEEGASSDGEAEVISDEEGAPSDDEAEVISDEEGEESSDDESGQPEEPSEPEDRVADACGHVHAENCYVLKCTHKHDAACGYVKAHPCEFVCGICRFVVNDWEWVDLYEALQPSEYFYGFDDVDWVLGIPNLTREQLLSILPAKINVTLKTGEKVALPITWDLAHPAKYPLPAWMRAGVENEADLPKYYIISAYLPAGYSLAKRAPELSVLVQMMGVDELAVDGNRSDYIYNDAIDPADTVVNLFDYWTLNQRSDHNINNPANQFASDFRTMWGYGDVGSGINNNHVLLFAGYFGLDTQDTSWNNGSNSGNWNAWTGGTNPFYPNNAGNTNFKPYQGIVDRNMVKGTRGDTNVTYPRLALTDDPRASNYDGNWNNIVNDQTHRTESLEYLFNPDYPHDGKASYPDVTGLFRMDSQGYYYYDSNESFAELNANQDWNEKSSVNGGNKITLYKETWKYRGNETNNTSGNYEGQFFPFNHWAGLFTNQWNGLSQNWYTLQQQAEAGQPMNHYFGMTVTTKFQQPKDGIIYGDVPMSFEFSGDDDVWIFIDGVLVGDIGGIHLPDGIKINFATGAITYTALSANSTDKTITHMSTTIYECFRSANALDKTAWNDKKTTFANGTIHTLQFFYMERGNDVSNCSIRFNLEPVLKDNIKKVNEDGDTLDNAEFELYEASLADGINSGKFNSTVWHIAEEFKLGKLIAGPLKSRNAKGDDPANSGFYDLVDANGDAIDFATKYNDGAYFILKESKTPEGYRYNKNIVLEYHAHTNTFTVVNKYETGAYASFVAKWMQKDENLYYAEYDPATGDNKQSTKVKDPIAPDILENGLAIVVPVYKQMVTVYDQDGNPKKDAAGNDEKVFQRWLPMYGSNTLGWQTITDSYQNPNKTISEQDFIRDLALAAFLQIVDGNFRDWYLKYDEATKRLSGDLLNLPGDATRYAVNNPDNADLNLVTLFISARELEVLLGKSIPNNADDVWRYEQLKFALDEKIAEKRESNPNISDEDAVNKILEDIIKAGQNDNEIYNPFRLLYSDALFRKYRTALYIPNERRELRVRKIDGNTEDGTPVYINGAVFAIFKDPASAAKFPGTIKFKSTEAAVSALNNALSNPDNGILSVGQTATVYLDEFGNKQDGLLIFRENSDNNGAGYAHITWPSAIKDEEHDATPATVWLKEIYSPDGYARNENLVRIEVGDLAIYANATGYDENGDILTDEYAKAHDGIRVYAALGKLTQSLVKYAMNNNVDITLRDILITLQQGKMGANGALIHEASDSWEDKDDQKFNLHFGLYSEVLTSQYGQHAYDMPLPIFVSDDGYVRIMPRQNTEDFHAGADYYKTLRTELNKIMYDDALKRAEEEAEKNGTVVDKATIKASVEAEVERIIADLAEIHSYDAKRDILTEDGSEDGKPIDLDGLFGLMNIVEITNKVIPVSLKISKQVIGNVPKNDIYGFVIKLTATNETTKWTGLSTTEGDYHAYLHQTDHQIPVYDQHGNQIPVLNEDGTVKVDDDGNTVYQTRPCGPADHTSDDNHVHLKVDAAGYGWVVEYTEDENANPMEYLLTLKDGWSFVVVGLPHGANYEIEEIVYVGNPDNGITKDQYKGAKRSETLYQTTYERRNDMREWRDWDNRTERGDGSATYQSYMPNDPNCNETLAIKGNGKIARGQLQTAEYAWYMGYVHNGKKPENMPEIGSDEYDDIVVPASEVHFINVLAFDVPSTGGSGTAVYLLSGMTLLLIGAAALIVERKRRAANEQRI